MSGSFRASSIVSTVMYVDRVDAEVFPDLLDGVRRGDELLVGGDVDAVEAGELGRRRGYAHVDLLRAGVAEHLDDLPHGGAAHDRVVHHDDPLSRPTESRTTLYLIFAPKSRIFCEGSMKVRPM